MERLIERNEGRYGAKRVLIFAEELNRNIDIPMFYGLNNRSSYEPLILEYLKAGGNKNLLCLKDYSERKNNQQPLNTISVQQLLEQEEKLRLDKKQNQITKTIKLIPRGKLL